MIENYILLHFMTFKMLLKKICPFLNLAVSNQERDICSGRSLTTLKRRGM